MPSVSLCELSPCIHARRISEIYVICVKRTPCERSELLYIPEHLMRVEARTSLGRSPRQITMSDDLSIRKHLMKDGQQIRQPFSLGRRTGVARQSVLIQPTPVADAYGTMVVRHGVSPHFQQHAMLRHRTVATDIEVIPDLTKLTGTVVTEQLLITRNKGSRYIL